MDAKLRYKAKKIKIVFFDIDDTLRNSKTGFIPASIPTVFKQLREKGILTGYFFWTRDFWCRSGDS